MSKSILITGCSSGIGRTAATLLQEQGYHVITSARQAEDVDSLKAAGFDAVQLDLNDSQSIQAAVQEVAMLSDHKLFALFNNAGYGTVGAVEDLSREVLRQQFETNVFGLIELTNLLLPMMRANKQGRIINVSSILGLVSFPYRGSYNASKFALEALTDAMRQELHGTNIHVSLIEPGPIESKFREHAIEQYHQHLADKTSHHQKQYQTIYGKTVDKTRPIPFMLGPEAVVAKVSKALKSKRPKPRYYVTLPTHLFAFMKRILSSRGMDRFIRLVVK